MTLSYELQAFQAEVTKIDKETQSFVFDMRQRIKDVEYNMGSDWDKPQYKKGLSQIKFLERCINTIVLQQNMSVTLTDLIWKEHLWTLEKETELAMVKLELNRVKQNNSFLLRMCTKLDGKRILHPKYINKI